MMGRSTQQLYPQSYSQEENDKIDELLRISRGGQLYDDWWKATIDTEKPKKDYELWKGKPLTSGVDMIPIIKSFATIDRSARIYSMIWS